MEEKAPWRERREAAGRGGGGHREEDGERRPRARSAERGARYRERDDERPCVASLLNRVLTEFFIFLPNQKSI